jgi:hypothetical protein
MSATDSYIPGICNIGPAEIKRRRQSGYIGLIVTIILWAVLAAIHSPAGVRLLVFFPVMMSASGFIQSYKHFCAGFGMKGLFNFGTEVGQTDTVAQKEFRSKDRREALQILGYSAVSALIAALIAYFVH